jgi:hypothetical protein
MTYALPGGGRTGTDRVTMGSMWISSHSGCGALTVTPLATNRGSSPMLIARMRCRPVPIRVSTLTATGGLPVCGLSLSRTSSIRATGPLSVTMMLPSGGRSSVTTRLGSLLRSSIGTVTPGSGFTCSRSA